MMKIKMKKNQQRELRFQNVELSKKNVDIRRDEKTGDVYLKFKFSSEYPVERYFGMEILSHEPGAMNEERLRNHAPSLYNHNWDQLMGVVVDCGIENKVAWVETKMSKSAFALEKLVDIESGVLVNVSFGYWIDEIVLMKKGQNGELDTYLATKWTPYEVSHVTVPADYTVGIGRSLHNPEEEIEIEVVQKEAAVEETPAVVETPAAAEPETAAAAASADGKTEDSVDKTVQENKSLTSLSTKTFSTEGKKMEVTKRNQKIYGLTEKFSGMEAFAKELVQSEKTWDECYDAIMEKSGAKKHVITPEDGNIGLSEKELNKFSVVRLLNAALSPKDNVLREAAAFELEISQAAQKGRNMSRECVSIPLDLLRHKQFHKRDQTVGSNPAGGFLVQNEYQSFIEMNRETSVLKRAGASEINGAVGNLIFPRQVAGSTYYWVGEGAPVAKSDLTFGQFSFKPKTVAARVVMSRKSLLQVAEMEMLVRKDINVNLGLGQDVAGLYGTGTDNMPAGLNIVDGVAVKNFAAAIPTHAETVAMKTAIGQAHAARDNMKYLMNWAMAGDLETTPKVAGHPVFLLENDKLGGYATDKSEQIAAGDLWLGDWSQLLIVNWSGIDLLVNPYSEDDKGNVIVTAMQDTDMGPLHAEAFCKGADNP